MKIDVEDANSAVGHLGKHASAATEIIETMRSTANDFSLPEASTARSFGYHLQDLANKMKNLLQTAANNTSAADNSSVFDDDLKALKGALGWEPPIAYSTTPVSVAFDELVPDLEAGQYYVNDHSGDSLWGPDGKPSIDDVDQGDFGDCWLLAVLNSMAAVNPDRIKGLITDHGDGTYTVHLATGDVEVSDSALPNTNASNQKWVQLVEYAYAQKEGTYQKIDGGYGTNAMKVIFGLDSDHYDPDSNPFSTWPWDRKDPEDAFDSMAATLGKGLPVTVEVHDEHFGFPAHELAVTGFVWIDGVRYAKVRNPWGNWPSDVADTWKSELKAKGSEQEPGVSNPDPGTLLVPADGLAKACKGASEAK